MKLRSELLKRHRPRLALKTNQTAVKADSRATELLKTNKYGQLDLSQPPTTMTRRIFKRE